MTAPTVERTSGTPKAPARVLRIERVYRPDMARQVRALLLLLTIQTATRGPGGGDRRGGAL
jgi:hypothetical protein